MKIHNIHIADLKNIGVARTRSLAGQSRVRLVCCTGVVNVRLEDLPHLLTAQRSEALTNANRYIEPHDLQPDAAEYLENLRTENQTTRPVIARLNRESEVYSAKRIATLFNADKDNYGPENSCWLAAFSLWHHFHVKPTLMGLSLPEGFLYYSFFVSLAYKFLHEHPGLQADLGIATYIHKIEAKTELLQALPHLTMVEERSDEPMFIGGFQACHFFIIFELPSGEKCILEKNSSNKAVLSPISAWQGKMPDRFQTHFYVTGYGCASALFALAEHFKDNGYQL